MGIMAQSLGGGGGSIILPSAPGKLNPDDASQTESLKFSGALVELGQKLET